MKTEAWVKTVQMTNRWVLGSNILVIHQYGKETHLEQCAPITGPELDGCFFTAYTGRLE